MIVSLTQKKNTFSTTGMNIAIFWNNAVWLNSSVLVNKISKLCTLEMKYVSVMLVVVRT